MAKITCAVCAKSLADENAVYQHMKRKHQGATHRKLRPPRPEREPSMADELVDAMIAASCGESVPDYIEEMFSDEIAAVRGEREAM